MSEAERPEGPRGSVLVFALAFALLGVGTWLAYKGNTQSSLELLWWSIGLSALALVTALLSVLIPRR